VNEDEVIGIHLQSVLDSVGVRNDSKDGGRLFAFCLNENGTRDVVEFSRDLLCPCFACLRGGWKYDDISVHIVMS